jgi:uncharacterized membrane protein YbhN (UPF0104 family)
VATAARRVLTGRTARAVLAVAVVVVVFVWVLPRITDYSAAWASITALTGPEAALLGAVALVNLFSYAPLWMAALPGLGLGRATLVDQTSTAFANALPVGFAVGVGATAAMFRSFGFTAGEITRAVVVTGVWNNLVKLATPVAAIAALAWAGGATDGMQAAAVVGLAVLAGVIGVFALGLTRPGVAVALAGGLTRMARPVYRALRRPPPTGWVAGFERFRTDSLALLQDRWGRLTVTAVASHAALFALLLTTLWLVAGGGSGAGWPEVLAVFAFTRLVTLVPITPGALGVAELSYVAGLVAVGVPAGAAAGAVLVFRFLTWFLPIPLGMACWLLWRRGAGQPAPLPRAPEPARS